MAQLIELDALEILVIVDNELDPFSSCSNDSVKQSGSVMDIAMRPSNQFSSESMGTYQELRMDNICCSAHGLSMMITGIKGDNRHTVLFDAGPEGEAWERNANRLQAEIGDIEVVTLSHWHRDHSGGMPRALQMIQAARKKRHEVDAPLLVDLHPDRPDFRGIRIPGMPVISLEADPMFAEFEGCQGVLDKRSLLHTILDDMFLMSGEMPRIAEYEKGFKFGVRFDAEEGQWVDDEDIADERILICKLKNKGIVMFTGCGHAGLINSSKHAIDLGLGSELYAVIGGFHLAAAQPEVVKQTVDDLKQLGVKVVLAGHCTGWRAKFEFHHQLPGCFSPCSVGSRFVL